MEKTTAEFGGHFNKLPMIPRSLIVQMQYIQSRDVALNSVYFGEGLNGAIVQRLMLDRGKCNIINTLSSNIAMFV